MSKVNNECVITSCGYISREVYNIKDRDRNFYNLGAMGSSLAIGLGLAYQRPDLKIIIIQGDGATLMSLGTMVLQHHLELPNIRLYILNNHSHASTGGQPTCFQALGDFEPMKNLEIINCGKESNAPRIPLTCKQIKERFIESIRLKKK